MTNKTNYNAGFSLVEIAIVLVIIGLISAGIFNVASMQIEAAKLQQSKEKITKITKAMQLYLATNGVLPCPASGTIVGKAANYGEASSAASSINSITSDATCSTATGVVNTAATIYIGVVPTRTLDLSDEYMLDGWGNRISYIVSKNCIDKDNWVALGTPASSTLSPYGCITNTTTTASDTSAVGGAITIQDNAGGTKSSNAVYAVISHGKNGIGSYKTSGTRTTGVTCVSFEADNASLAATACTGDSYNANFRDDNLLDYTGAANYFDDIVQWKTGPQMQYDKLLQ